MAKRIEKISTFGAVEELTKGLKQFVIRPNIYGYKPHEVQENFHKSEKKIRIFKGGNRSGKTVGGTAETVFRLRGQHPYQRVPNPPVGGRIVGVDFINGIEQILKPELARWLPVGDLKGGSWYSAYDNEERLLTLENGSTLQFRSYEQDTDKFAGVSLNFIHLDEEPPQPIYQECLARTIDTGGCLYITYTPVEQEQWLIDEVYELGKAGHENIDIFEVDMRDNPHLNEGEIQIFESTLTEEEIEYRIHGHYQTRAGRIFKDFDTDLHVIDPELFDHRDPGLLVATSMDHGFANATAWGWFVVDNDERVTQFYEHYESGKTIDYHAAKVFEINKQLGVDPEYSVADPSVRNTNAVTGTSILEEYAKYGVYLIPGNNDVNAGLIRVAKFLKSRGESGPGFRVTKNCVNTIREFRRYRWKKYNSQKVAYKNNQPEMPQKKDDHAMDMIRYFIMSRPDLSAMPLTHMVEGLPKIAGLGSLAATNYDDELNNRNRESPIPVTVYSGETQWYTNDNIEGDY